MKVIKYPCFCLAADTPKSPVTPYTEPLIKIKVAFHRGEQHKTTLQIYSNTSSARHPKEQCIGMVKVLGENNSSLASEFGGAGMGVDFTVIALLSPQHWLCNGAIMKEGHHLDVSNLGVQKGSRGTRSRK